MSFSFNNPLIIGDINAPIKSEIGNLDDLQTTDKSSLVNALNEALDSTLNGASRDLDNLSDVGNDKLRSLNAYANEGELLQDADGLAFVKNYAHSTFDRSKFTVVGSPNITDDGIASGFSGSNFIKINQNIDWSKPFVITAGFKRDSKIKTNARLIGFNGPSGQSGYSNILCCDSTDMGYKLSITVGGSGANLSIINGTVQYIFEYGKYYDIILSFDGIETYNLKYKESSASNYISCDNVVNRGTMVFTNPTVIGYVDAQQWDGSIDLKQFSITVDGVEVFSGNKTGIDTIKPDDYTVVGTPTISADGIASGFSSSNYLQATIPSELVGTPNKWEMVTRFYFTYNASVAKSQAIFCTEQSGQNSGILCYVSNSTTSKSSISLTLRDSNFQSIYSTQTGWSDNVLQNNTWYYVKAVCDNLSFKLGISMDGKNWTYPISTILLGQPYFTAGNFYVGNRINDLNLAFLGSIDLNSFKIYVDGNLVYQPCLKIPFALSKTGAKIVDSIYRDRVNDMASQFGYAPYYTLSDTDFTLPQVEIYGNIQRTLRDSYRSGATYWELWSDRTLEIGGTCTSGVEYNLPRSFTSATDYVLSVPYSAKTASSFTPTVSGDFIAKGLGVL